MFKLAKSYNQIFLETQFTSHLNFLRLFFFGSLNVILYRISKSDFECNFKRHYAFSLQRYISHKCNRRKFINCGFNKLGNKVGDKNSTPFVESKVQPKKTTFQVFKHYAVNKDLKNTNVVKKKLYKTSLKKEKTNV